MLNVKVLCKGKLHPSKTQHNSILNYSFINKIHESVSYIHSYFPLPTTNLNRNSKGREGAGQVAGQVGQVERKEAGYREEKITWERERERGRRKKVGGFIGS